MSRNTLQGERMCSGTTLFAFTGLCLLVSYRPLGFMPRVDVALRSDWLDGASPVVAVSVARYCVALDFVGIPGLSYAQNKAPYQSSCNSTQARSP